VNILSYITSLFWEKKCYACGQVWHFFCPECSLKIYTYKPYCYVCKGESNNFIVHKNCTVNFPLGQVIVLTRYRQNIIKKFLRHGKYYWKYTIYEDIISGHKDFFKTHIIPQNRVLLPVPMHFLRRWKRWYNQSEKIAQVLSYILDIPVNNKIVYKKKYTKNQSHLSKVHRKNNLTHSFRIRKNVLNKNTTIYLIDDVVSTASTLSEIAQTLKKQGFSDIRAIVLASD